MFRFSELPPDYTQTHSFLDMHRHGVEMIYHLADRIMSERLYKIVQVDPVPVNERISEWQLPVRINQYERHGWVDRRLCPCGGRGHGLVGGTVCLDVTRDGLSDFSPYSIYTILQHLDFRNPRVTELVKEFNSQERGIHAREEGEPKIRPPDVLWGKDLDRRLADYLRELDRRREEPPGQV